ncbi:hypothetical protein O159_24720 [Leifsonia xyli subsp. cynodontis DSM 46306]|uniref:Glycosyltransferase RgtA/B/C/D-like domain-containing protein n=1 Tax=Leifsonia xyli subsp. cynodontis DSM 46306 TaxID=1389489 RepID=U3PA80_LEIXC|nr:hypothetical protein [Leifsonia xyli]AGW42409.1 hypothetical protein O159_24720 [Leifsonia xyli subsp. cynodontis DSM 46306]
MSTVVDRSKNVIPGPPTALPPQTRAIAVAFGLIATAVSAAGSGVPSLWGDEAASLLSAQRPLPSLLRMLTHVDAVHGLYYLGLHGWIRLVGDSPFAIRFPNAVAIGLAVAAITVLASRHGGPVAAIAASIAGTVLPRLTYAGEEARSFAFTAAAAGWLTLLLVWLIDGRGRDAPARAQRWRWALYAAGMTVASYLFLYFASMLVAHLGILVFARASRPVLRAWAISAGAVLLVLSPLALLAFFERRQIAYLGRETLNPQQLLAEPWFGSVWDTMAAWAAILLALGGGLLLWRRAGGRFRPGRAAARTGTEPPQTATLSTTVVAGCWLVLPTAVLFLANLVFPLYTPRYSTFTAPAAALLVAEGVLLAARLLASRSRVPMAAAAGAGLLAFAAICLPAYLSQRGPYSKANSDWSEVSAAIGEYARPGDAVVFDESTRPSRRPRLAARTYPAGFAAVKDVTLRTPFAENIGWEDKAYSVPEAAALGRFDGVRRVWLIEDDEDGNLSDYGLADLETLGFEETGLRVPTHRTLLIELSR